MSHCCQALKESVLVSRAVGNNGWELSQSRPVELAGAGRASFTKARASRLPTLTSKYWRGDRIQDPLRPFSPSNVPRSLTLRPGNAPTKGHTCAVRGPLHHPSLHCRWTGAAAKPVTVCAWPVNSGDGTCRGAYAERHRPVWFITM